jgi:hypothetical protein
VFKRAAIHGRLAPAPLKLPEFIVVAMALYNTL